MMNNKERILSHGYANRDTEYGSLKPLIRSKGSEKFKQNSDPKSEQAQSVRRIHGQPEITFMFFKDNLMGVSSNYTFDSLPEKSKSITVRFKKFEGIVSNKIAFATSKEQFSDVQKLFSIIMGGIKALQQLSPDSEEVEYGPENTETVSKETKETATAGPETEETERSQQCSEQGRETTTERCATSSKEICSEGGCK